METLRKSRERQAEKRGRDARASRRAGGRSTKGAQSRVAERSVAKKRAPPSSVAIDASAPYQPPTANDDNDDEYVDDDDKDDENDSEYEEVDVPIKRASKFPSKKKKKSIAPTTAKENAAEDAAPANDGPRMPLGMLQMPTLGAKKNKGVDGEQQKKRRLNRQSAIPRRCVSHVRRRRRARRVTERANHRRRAVHNFSIIQLHHNLPQPRAIHRLAPSLARPSSSSPGVNVPRRLRTRIDANLATNPPTTITHTANTPTSAFFAAAASPPSRHVHASNMNIARGVTLPMSPSTSRPSRALSRVADDRSREV